MRVQKSREIQMELFARTVNKFEPKYIICFATDSIPYDLSSAHYPSMAMRKKSTPLRYVSAQLFIMSRLCAPGIAKRSIALCSHPRVLVWQQFWIILP
jgi:hypothetical protein